MNKNLEKNSTKIKNNIFNEEIIEEDLIHIGIKSNSNSSKMNEILDNLNLIKKDQNLKELGNLKEKENQEISVLANILYNELEIFLTTHLKDKL